MNKEEREWLERLIRENKESDSELTYTYCPFSVLYALQQENEKLKEKNTIYKSTIKGQYNKIKELQNAKRISKEVHKKRNKKLQEESQKLKEEILKLEDKYIHNVPCCNEEDCEFYKKYKENEADLTTVYLKGYEDGKEKYNHYKLLYQKVKERNDKAIEYVENNTYTSAGSLKTTLYLQNDELYDLLEILKGNNETKEWSMELKEGMYVRTDKGFISQIIEFKEHYTKGKRLVNSYSTKEVVENYLSLKGNQCEFIESIDCSIPPCYPSDEELEKIKSHIVKASNDIIDLIEVGDYVNGLLVQSNDYNFDKPIKIFSYLRLGKEDIKSIVTKEQFESMSYKVGE